MTDAHSLYLQSLAELGIVGFVLILVVVLGDPRRPGHADPRAPTERCTPRCSPTSLAWAVHQAFDWDWQMPAVTLGVFMLAGLALARPRTGESDCRACRPAAVWSRSGGWCWRSARCS